MMSARMFSDSEGRLRCSHQLHSSCTRPRLPSSCDAEAEVRRRKTFEFWRRRPRAREICVAGPMTRSGAVGLDELRASD